MSEWAGGAGGGGGGSGVREHGCGVYGVVGNSALGISVRW